MSTTISSRNSSNASFYRRHGRRGSLLCHPVGLEVLKEYKKLKKAGIDNELDSSFADILAKALQPVVRRPETDISYCLVEAIRKHWCQSDEDLSSARGESEEAVKGTLDQKPVSGKPDGVVRMNMTPFYGPGAKKKEVQLIIEFSVDKNGGEKKMGQAFDYASLTKDPSKTVLLFTFHVDRKPDLKITQEAFIYLHSENEEERKMGLLWREVYDRAAGSEEEFLKKSCEGLVRCLYCTRHNRDAQVICSTIEYPSQWKVVSDNAAICKGEYVFKIFDNRFYPTHRRPDEWLNKQRPWIAKLGVETEVEFKESSTVDALGRPTISDRKRPHDSDSPKYLSQTEYPRGSVLVIKYKYVKGTHYASRVSHFREIACCISEMHGEDTVHGDIRGFNMLHPYPPTDNEEHNGGISESLLIDFDLSGTPGKDRYPPGYSKTVKDNAFDRSGAAGHAMQKVDDWKDLGSVMAHYFPTLEEYEKSKEAWVELWRDIRQGKGSAVALLDDFIKKHSDIKIEISDVAKENMDQIETKGTESPNKLQQKPRGSLTVDQSSK